MFSPGAAATSGRRRRCSPSPAAVGVQALAEEGGEGLLTVRRQVPEAVGEVGADLTAVDGREAILHIHDYMSKLSDTTG